MNKKITLLTCVVIALSLFSFMSYAGTLNGTGSGSGTSSFSFSSSSFDVSIDRVVINGRVLTQSRTNLINDADIFSLVVEFTTLGTLEKAHVEASLRGRQTGETVSDSTGVFDLAANQSSGKTLTLTLIERLKREKSFDLTVKIIDARGRLEERTYTINTETAIRRGLLDVSIDRVIMNNKVVAESNPNFIDESNDFNAIVEFTALEDLSDAHVQAVLRDINSGNVVADATVNFDLRRDLSSSKSLKLELLDKLKRSSSFELEVMIKDAEGDFVQKKFGIRMRDSAANAGLGFLDISIDSVEVEGKVVAENEDTLIIPSDAIKELGVKVRLTSLENVNAAHIETVLAFENGDVVADATTNFNIGKNQNLIKKLNLPLVRKFEEGNFKLTVKIIDAEGDFEQKAYGLKISHSNFPFAIRSVSVQPDSVQAGKILMVTVGIKNIAGLKSENFFAKAEIQGTDASISRFIDQSKSSLAEFREEFILNIPDDTEAGTYTLRLELNSESSAESTFAEIPISITGKEGQPFQNERIVVQVPITKQDILNDGSEVFYPITFTNEGTDAKAYTLLLNGNNWADLRLSDSDVFVLMPKESKTIRIYTSTKSNIGGNRNFLVTLRDSNKTLKEIQITGNVILVKSTASSYGMGSFLKISLIIAAILVFAVIVFFIIKAFAMGIDEGNGKPKQAAEKDTGGLYYS